MALEIAAAIIGILAAAGKVAETLGPYVSAWKHAPKNAVVVLSEVNASRICLSALQKLLDHLDATSPSRKNLIQIDQLIATFTDGVLLFSELETIVIEINENRTKWAWKDSELAALVSRLQCFKSSISFMLNILQCGSDQEAIHSGQELLSLTSSLLQSNLDLSRRMARLENYLIKDGSICTSRPASIATITAPVQSQPTTERSDLNLKVLPLTGLLFELDLIASRVYRKARRSTCDASFRSSVVESHAWSVLSDISLSDISALSVVALPVERTEVLNAQHYKFHETLISSKSVEPLESADRRYSSSSSIATMRELRPGTRIQLIVHGTRDTEVESLTSHWAERRFRPSICPSLSECVTVHYSKECIIEDHPASLDIDIISDPPSLYGYHIIGEDYIDRGELFMLVFSIRSRSSLDYIRLQLTHIIRKHDFIPHSMTIVANHCAGSLKLSERKLLEEGEALARYLGCNFFKVTNDNPSAIETAFRDLIREKWGFERKERNKSKSLQMHEPRGRSIDFITI